MPLTYLNNIPQATDALATSQPQILTNFASIETLIDVDHADFAAVTYGQHNKVSLPVQISAPSFAAGTIGLYNVNSSLTSNNELYITNSAGTSYPVTAADLATTGWCYLPSGLIMKWGVNSGNGSTTISYPTGATIPVFATAVLTAQVTNTYNSATDVNTAVTLSSYSTTAIKVYCSARTTTGAATTSFTWLVIGY